MSVIGSTRASFDQYEAQCISHHQINDSEYVCICLDLSQRGKTNGRAGGKTKGNECGKKS